MNKKNLAMAMAAVTVVGSAAPIFADSTTPSVTNANKYTVVKSKYKNLLDEIKKMVKENDDAIQKYIDDNSGDADDAWTALKNKKELNLITMEIRDDDNKEVVKKSTVRTGGVVNVDYVEDQMKNLKSDRYMDFEITKKSTSTSQKNIYSSGELNRLAASSGAAITTDIESTTAKTLADGGLKSQVVVAGSTASIAATGTTFASYFKVGGVTTDGSKIKVDITVAEPSTGSVLITDEIGTNVAAAPTAQQKMKIDTPTITLKEGEQALDFTKPLFDNGTFKGFAPKADIPSQSDEETVSVRVVDAKEETIKATDSDAIKAIAQKYSFESDDISAVYEEAKSLNDKDKLDGSAYDKDGTYKAVFFAKGKRLQGFSKSNDAAEGLAPVNTPLKLVIESTDEDDFIDGLKDLKDYNNSYSDVDSISGDDRIETAIELSKSYYNNDIDDNSNTIKKDAVDNVVLVGSQAIVDGLVAGPLAAEKTAPLLLTSKDQLDSNVKNEIKRVMGLSSNNAVNTKKKVYVVGGENSVSKDVLKSLEDMGLKVERFAGNDRYETSLKIADEVELNNDNKAFVVGGTGLADAMSIAPVASQLKGKEATPIVVVDGKADALSSDAKDFLDSADKVDIIGGENSVSDKVKASIKDTIDRSVDRISGDDRQATNAEVIKEYYEASPKNVKNVFLAKDGSTKEDQLVDALAAGPIAANLGTAADKISPAPIVLATDNLSSEQHVAISKVVDDNASNKIVKVGGGIADSVVKKLKDLVGM
ncbi:S-layer protein SlpA [Clostridioides difficile]|uniref:S-layer protein SlpA n=1 Tax=Clostridioides difficile TaxID=1496 RepID=UPI000C9ABAB0|nr:S-layer protein SlpA [Clostridioides difficile]HBG7287185.1 S-layer protein SlpA [Clostridioides difficile]